MFRNSLQFPCSIHPHLSVTAGEVNEFQLTLLQEVKFQLNAQKPVGKSAQKHCIFPRECQHQIQELTIRGNNSITVSMTTTIWPSVQYMCIIWCIKLLRCRSIAKFCLFAWNIIILCYIVMCRKCHVWGKRACRKIPYSRKHWWELNYLVVGSQMAINLYKNI